MRWVASADRAAQRAEMYHLAGADVRARKAWAVASHRRRGQLRVRLERFIARWLP